MKGRAAERASLFNSAQQFPRSASSRWLNMENDGMSRRDHHLSGFRIAPPSEPLYLRVPLHKLLNIAPTHNI